MRITKSWREKKIPEKFDERESLRAKNVIFVG